LREQFYCPRLAFFIIFTGVMQNTSQQTAWARYELPAQNLEQLYSIFNGIQKALVQGNTKSALELCTSGQQQLRDVVICFE
jgi:NADH dehydrogenase FAD-containing subunit